MSPIGPGRIDEATANEQRRNPSLEDVVRRVFDLPADEIRDEMTPDDIHGWDSLGHLALVTELEATYHVMLSSDEVVSMVTIGDIRGVLRKRRVPV